MCLSGRGLCDGLITRPGESYRLWCVLVCDHETSGIRRLKHSQVGCKCQIEEEEEQDVQCTYNLILRRVHEAIITMEKQKLLQISVCVGGWKGCGWKGCGCTRAGVSLRSCSLNYPAWNAPPYCHLRPLCLYHIFRHFLIKARFSEKKIVNIKYVYCFFFYKFRLNHFSF